MAKRVGIDELRAKDRAKKAEQRKADSVVIVPPCADRERRARLEADDVEWLLYYFGPGCELDDVFTYRFVGDQLDMIRAIRHAIRHGDDQAIAAPRGSGKSTLANRQLLKAALAGEINYSVLCASTGGLADNALDAIKTALSENPLLAADYPEVCVPVIALEGAPQRANTQRVSGDRHDNGEPYEMAETKFTWCGQEIIFPRVPGSPSAGAIIATRGLDAAVRGLNKRGKRPKLVIVDDPDTEDTSRSEEQAAKLEKRIDAALGFLGGQTKTMGRVILTTLQSRVAVSYKFTDPKQKPTFKPRRFRFLVVPPDRADMWAEYVAMRREDLQRRAESGEYLDEFARRSHQFYLDNFEAMNAGHAVSNPHRFDSSILPDGSQKEVSALQRYYNEVARVGQVVVSTEFDNDPPEETAVVESPLTPEMVQRKVSGYGRGIIPPGCTLLTAGIDVGKWRLHWVVRAWRPDGTGYVVDYGTHATHGAVTGVDVGLDVAIHRAILECVGNLRDAAYCTEGGEIVPVALTLVDAGYRTDAVYAAVHALGLGAMPVMGFGKSDGCVSADFSGALRATADKRPGDNWFLSNKGKLWLVCANADHWKTWEHDRWMTATGEPGSLQMWGVAGEDEQRLSEDQKQHAEYGNHITAESEVDEPWKGTLRRRWRKKRPENHWGDASYYADVAMSIKGIRIAETAPSIATATAGPPASRPSLSQLAKGRR